MVLTERQEMELKKRVAEAERKSHEVTEMNYSWQMRYEHDKKGWDTKRQELLDMLDKAQRGLVDNGFTQMMMKVQAFEMHLTAREVAVMNCVLNAKKRAPYIMEIYDAICEKHDTDKDVPIMARTSVGSIVDKLSRKPYNYIRKVKRGTKVLLYPGNGYKEFLEKRKKELAESARQTIK